MKNKFSIAMSLAVMMAILLVSLALASDVNESIVDATAPSGSVTLNPGGNGAITINLSITGKQDGTATFEVYKDWTLSGGSFTGSNPETFTIPPRAASDPATTFTRSGTVMVAPGQGASTFTLAVGAFNITNSNATGAKLGLGNTSNYVVTVEIPTPSDTAAPTINCTPPATSDWYGSDVSVPCTASDSESGLANSADAAFSLSTNVASGTETATADTNTRQVCDNAGNCADAGPYTFMVDKKAPTISFVSRTAANGNNWNNSDVTVTWSCSDGGSGVVSASASQTVSTEGAGQSATGTCTDNVGNSASDIQTGINIDKTLPTISASISPTAAGTGWYNSVTGAPTVSFSCNDTGGSGLAGSCPSAVALGEGADQSVSGGPVSDVAGNSSGVATISNIDVDLTAPTVALVGGPANGSSYYFGSVPAAPSCSASDGLSGLAGACSVSGYSTAVGPHTVTASASDNAGNSASASVTYTVLAWTLNGFYQPVDMGIVNVAKNGSTVPLKFEVFAGTTELTNTSIINTFVQKLTCGTGAATDDIENYATGGTSLRYDTTGGQFIFNWQTPKIAGNCYRVTVTTQDGSSISADFRLK